MTGKFPKGLDNRMRDKNGEIREKRGDTLLKSIRKEHPNFYPEFRGNMKLGTLREIKNSTFSELIKKAK